MNYPWVKQDGDFWEVDRLGTKVVEMNTQHLD